MEGRLFFISLWCGVYGQILRAAFRSQQWVRKMWVIMALNSLFWATFAALVGMLVSSYFEQVEDMSMYSMLFAAVGLIVGAVNGYKSSKDEKSRDVLLRDNLEWADTGFSAILLASFVMFFLIQAFKIPSGSMRMTFVEGDHLFVNKFVYGIPVPLTHKKFFPLRKVTRGDVVIFRFPAKDKNSQHYGKDFIKRVIATEGETVQVVDKEVFVNGVKLDEPYKQHVDSIVFPGLEGDLKNNFQEIWEAGQYEGNEIRDNFGPIVVPAGRIMVMGDNRDRSYDSRFWGPLPLTEIKGKALLLYWPPKRFHLVH